MKVPRRLRLAFDRHLSASSVMEVASELHPDKFLLHPERPLPYPDFADSALTTGMLQRFVARCGEAFREVGMRRGDRVAIFKRNEVDYALLSLAVIRAGGVAVPINSKMRRDDLVRHIQRAEVSVLCSDCESFTNSVGQRVSLPSVKGWVFTDRAPKTVPAQVVLSEVLAELPGNEPPARLAADAPVMLAHTSGTTGTPKLVTCTAGSFLAGIRLHFRTEPALPWKRVGIAGPFSHLVYQIGISTLLLSGMSAWGLDGDDAEAALAKIEQERLNIFVAFPYLYLLMYVYGLDSNDLRSMRLWISVADASQEAHMATFCKKGSPLAGSLFVEPLGSSELGGPALRRIWSSVSRVRCRRHVGRPMLGGPQVKVVDAKGNRSGAGEPGRLIVKGPTVFAGYWGKGKQSGGMANGWWATGDVVSRDRRGRYLHLDRESDVIHTSTGPFYTLPMEDVLHSYVGVYEAVVFGVPAKDGFEDAIAYVWVNPEAGVEEASLLLWANEQVDGPVGLASLTMVAPEDIPRSLTGKVLKASLREAYSRSRGVGVDAW